MAESVLYTIGRAIIPKRVRPDLRIYLLKAGYFDVPYELFGIVFFIASAISYLMYLLFFYAGLKAAYHNLAFGFMTFVTFAATMFFILFTLGVILYFYWNIKIYNRTKELELLLPDYLTLVSTNLKGGMSFENALWSAIKPEFGILANEIGLVSKKVMTGNDVSDALIEFSMKYDSPILRRNIQLMISEVESGGKIVETIDKIIYDMKKTQILKKEMASSTVTYMIFIGMLVIFICPVLFALSLQLFTIINGFLGSVGSNVSMNSTNLHVGASALTPKDFRIFSIAAITIISIFSSLIVAVIEKGEVKSGLKYIPMFLISSLTIYVIASGILGVVFKSLTFGG
jgi:pilus assembly protein TadC